MESTLQTQQTATAVTTGVFGGSKIWTNRKTRGITVLFVLAALGASCGGTPIIAETTNHIEQTIETTSTDINSSVASTDDVISLDQVKSNIGTDTSTTIGSSTTSIPSTVTSITNTSTVLDSTTTTNTTSITVASRGLSPAWIESRAMDSVFISDEIEDMKRANEYYSNNPNDTSTPMGALCWAYHELLGGSWISGSRYLLDYFAIPFFMHEAGIASEQFGPPGPEATGALLDMLSTNNGAVGTVNDGDNDQTAPPGGGGDIGPVGSTGDTSSATDVALEAFRILHEYAGDGTALTEAFRAVASPEMVTAFQANGGLPAEVQVYADALTSFAKEHVGKDLDHTAESDNLNFALPDFPGLKAFVEAAKYHPDCKRSLIEDQ